MSFVRVFLISVLRHPTANGVSVLPLRPPVLRDDLPQAVRRGVQRVEESNFAIAVWVLLLEEVSGNCLIFVMLECSFL